eukprot:COSAG01_NODE_33231_length_567_cov_3.474359_1_plen_22_part_10
MSTLSCRDAAEKKKCWVGLWRR